MIDKNNPPVVVTVSADNGEHSHFKLIDCETGKTLWEESETDGFYCGFFKEECIKNYGYDCYICCSRNK